MSDIVMDLALCQRVVNESSIRAVHCVNHLMYIEIMSLMEFELNTLLECGLSTKLLYCVVIVYRSSCCGLPCIRLLLLLL